MQKPSAPIVRVSCVLLAIAACTTSNERGDLLVTHVVRATAGTTATPGGSPCIWVPGTPEEIPGTVNTDRSPGYRLGLVVVSALPNNANAAVGRLNTNDFLVEQARVNYDFPGTAVSLSIPEHVTPVSFEVPAGSTTTVGGVPLIPADVLAKLKSAATSGTVRVRVRLEGKLHDGSKIQTGEYEYVVFWCSGLQCDAAPPPNPDGGSNCTGGTLVECDVGQNSDWYCQH